MKENKRVVPNSASGLNMSILQLFGSGPKWTINCGACGLTFKKRIQMIEEQGIKCPGCGAINVLSLTIRGGGR